jgi:hypothetical protein
MMAIGQMTVEQFFAGLYGNPNIEQEPMSAGRQMGGHATHSLNEDGSWKDLTNKKMRRYFSYRRTNAKIIRTWASKYRQVKGIPNKSNFSVGNEIAWELLETQVPLRDCF